LNTLPKLIDLIGSIRFEIRNKGTKSERKLPVLETENELIELHVEGDNPFVESSLLKFNNKIVKLQGVRKEKRLIVLTSSIKIINE